MYDMKYNEKVRKNVNVKFKETVRSKMDLKKKG